MLTLRFAQIVAAIGLLSSGLLTGCEPSAASAHGFSNGLSAADEQADFCDPMVGCKSADLEYSGQGDTADQEAAGVVVRDNDAGVDGADAGVQSPPLTQQEPSEEPSPDAGSEPDATPGEGSELGTELCMPSAEICDNGLDDDCDGLVDGLDVADCGCQPQPENCDNGLDDDCDGQVDCNDASCVGAAACVVDCTSYEGHDCNTDMGYGDHCAASDNWGGCSAERFWAWCNRRNPAYPEIWYEHLETWVDERCDGPVFKTDDDSNGYDEFVCTDTDDGRYYRCQTPLVLQFKAKDSVQFQPDDGLSQFDLSPARDGSGQRTDWPSAATPWLAMDRDGNGRIDSGRELFGSATLIQGHPAPQGFAALAALDVNKDRVIDKQDPDFKRLLAWTDSNADRRSQGHELHTVTALGITAISLDYQLQARCDARGNCERERAKLQFVDADGQAQQGAVIDVYLRVGPLTPRMCW